MEKNLIFQESEQGQFDNALESVLREGARKLLQQAIEEEVARYIDQSKYELDTKGHRLVTRNGHLPERKIQTGIGPLEVRQPRVRDKRKGSQFNSSILPKYARRTPSLESAIPTLYLKGVSTGDFSEALESLLGKNAPGLSSTNIVRLKQVWEKEYDEWQKRDLSNKNYVYMWVDGIYSNVRLTSDRPCILVIIGALANGAKELVAVYDGQRESKISWKEVLQDLKRRGLPSGPKLAIGDGALGFWAALAEEYPDTRQQRCWVHKTANILDKLPKSVQASAKKLIHEMYMAPSKSDAMKAYRSFIRTYEDRYPKACKCLQKDERQLFAFYCFPAKHWGHIRTTNPIESTFATVRHRTRQTKGCGSRKATMTMVYMLTREAEKSWRRLRGYELIDKVIQGVIFKDGDEVKEQAA